MTSGVQKFLYGVLFVAVLPAGLVLWAAGAERLVHLPVLHAPVAGTFVAVVGVAAMLSGMLALWRHGGGLPMNAFPPPRFVRRGVYALLPHPIYFGFTVVCAGCAVCFGSGAGLWLVTPAVALGSAALLLGYEVSDLWRRFGEEAAAPWMAADEDRVPLPIERVRVYSAVLLPWLVLFEAVMLLGPALGAVSTYLPFERKLPVWEWAEVPYASTYLVVLLAPLVIGSARSLRRFALRGLAAMAVMFPLYLILNVFVPPRPFTATTAIAPLLEWERVPNSGAGAFPSFHVVWALIAAAALGEGAKWKRVLWYVWAALVVVSCVATGMHSIADAVAGAIVFSLVLSLDSIWRAILAVAERVANSWKEWRFGPLRIINHGAYAGVGACVGMAMIGGLLGTESLLLMASIFLCSIAGAALWAQWVEGSPALLRPMGCYGGMIGAILGALPALVLGANLMQTLAAITVAAPWIQAIGRLRCLVQGCCHGAATVAAPGIRYTHPRSRVCRLAHLAGVPVYPTPVYSIVWNVIVGLMLLRLLGLHVPSTLLCGIYLLLSGFGRFVEEAYRGEPQTCIIWGLRLYQWIAMVTVFAGAVFTVVPSDPMPHGICTSPALWILAVLCGFGAWFVTGVDFPESSRRFARLT